MEPESRVFCVFDGIVSSVFLIGEDSRAVLIRHGEYITVYFPLSTVFVNENERVKKGTPLGIVARDKFKQTYELHFEIWNGKEPQDPLEWLYRATALLPD